MAHFAKLGLNGKVLEVIVVDNKELLNEDGIEDEQLGVDFLTQLSGYPIWVQASYNGTFRKNYPGTGCRYDEELDAFITPKPFSTWILNEDCEWEAPTPMPKDSEYSETNTEPVPYMWDEEIQDWAKLEEQVI